MIRRMNSRLVDMSDFCIAYRDAAQQGHSLAQLAATLEMSVSAVANRRNYHQKHKGLKFPKLKTNGRGRQPLTLQDIRELQNILNG
jgi:hypothetical protein